MAVINSNSHVLLHFTLKLADGSVADSSHNSSKPALFRLGDGSLSSALEAQLLGLREGDKHSFVLAPEAAFGAHNPDLIQFFQQRDFVATGIPEVGTIMLFGAVNGNEMPGIVREVVEESIKVDFNHPLAGHTITFDIEVLQVTQQ